ELPVPRANERRTAQPGFRDKLIAVEREGVLAALRAENWNLSRAAKRLGMPRNTLRHRLKKLGLLAELQRSEAATPTEASEPAPEEPVRSVTTQETRRLALLRLEVVPTSPDHAALAGAPIDIAIDKVQVFGGRIEEQSPTGLVASFGLEPLGDAPQRAALTA